MNLYFLRHGETNENIRMVYYGVLEVSINENGKRQAVKAGKQLENIEFDKIYCSERVRARETAEIVVGENEVIITDSRINEINFGIFEGKTYEQIRESYPEDHELWENNWKEFCPSGGESYSMLYERVKAFLEEIVQLDCENVLIVTHGGVIRTAFCYVMHENLDCFWKFTTKNCGIALIKYSQDYFYIDSIMHME